MIMMRTIIHTLSITLAVLTLFSCSNDDEGISLKDSYKSYKMEVAELRAFTKHGEIHDELTKQKIVDRYKTVNSSLKWDFYSAPHTFLEEDYTIVDSAAITLLNDGGRIKVNAFGFTDEFSVRVESNNLIRLVGLDTALILTSRDSFWSHLFYIKPLFEERSELPGSTGFYSYSRTIPERYFIKSGDELKEPFLNAFLFNGRNLTTNLSDTFLDRWTPGSSNGNSRGYATSISDINNQINEEAYKMLSDVDTLLVQQNWRLYK